MTEEYYRPTIIQPKDLDIDGTDYNADLNVIKRQHNQGYYGSRRNDTACIT